jgi:hypothetical protein
MQHPILIRYTGFEENKIVEETGTERDTENKPQKYREREREKERE